MTGAQKLGYLVSEWVIAWLLFYALFFIVFVPGSDDRWGTVLILFAVGAVMFSPLFFTRVISILKSNARVKGAAIRNRGTPRLTNN